MEVLTAALVVELLLEVHALQDGSYELEDFVLEDFVLELLLEVHALHDGSYELEDFVLELLLEVHALHDGSYELEVLTAALVVELLLEVHALHDGSYELVEELVDEEAVVVVYGLEPQVEVVVAVATAARPEIKIAETRILIYLLSFWRLFLRIGREERIRARLRKLYSECGRVGL